RRTPASAVRLAALRPPHLRYLQRRRLDGRREPRSRIARRSLQLGRMVFVYDDNHITIDGPTELAYTDNVPERFAGYGWHVIELGEAANDLDVLERGLRDGMAEADRPTLIVLRSHIGYPSPNFTDSEKAHGNPLGADEVARTKEILGLPPEDFYAPDD